MESAIVHSGSRIVLTLILLVFAIPAGAEEALLPFPPPLQYMSNPTKPYETLLATNVKWLKAKITDREERKRFEENRLRLASGEDKKPVQAALDEVNAELKDAEAALEVLEASQPDEGARRRVVKANVTEWINALDGRATNLRKAADAALDRAKSAEKELTIARLQADADEFQRHAGNADEEAKALRDDLAAAGL
jgi:hypothetical protein